MAGLHAHDIAGISGTASQGADAIVLNGGYPDDADYGNVIVYTGHGGQDPSTKKQIAHQTFADSGNAGLVKSQLDDLPVRVIRGPKAGEHGPIDGYRYDGLYKVVRHWFKTRSDGFQVCQFLLIKTGIAFDEFDSISIQELSISEPEPVAPGETASRKSTVVNRINRRARIAKQVKSLYSNSCQICKEAIQLPTGTTSEAAHIRPVGIPHNGPDSLGNLLCLCPNDHTRFDNGALYLTDDLKVVDPLQGTIQGSLYVHPRHRIDIDCVRYHRAFWER